MEQQLNLNTYSFRGTKTSYRVGTADEDVIRHSFDRDIFFKEIPSFVPSKRPVVLDIGAHIGTFSILSAIKYPDAAVYAFEAASDTFRVLERNKYTNGLKRLNIFHQAVAGVSGPVKLYHSEKTGNWGHSITKAISGSFEEVNATTLEDIITDNKIGFIDLVKFNCEGAECDIIHSASDDCIKRIGLAVILYHSDLDPQGGNIQRMMELFRNLDFRIDHIRKSEKRGWLIVWNRRRYSRWHFFYQGIRRRVKQLI